MKKTEVVLLDWNERGICFTFFSFNCSESKISCLVFLLRTVDEWIKQRRRTLQCKKSYCKEGTAHLDRL